jgi:sulfite exporter TauE/SafE
LKTVDKICAWMLIVLGCIHCAATFVTHRNLNFDSIWFFAGGVALIAAGLLNVIRTQSGKGGLPRISSIFVNVLLALTSVAIVWVARGSLLHGPQVIAVVIAVMAELIFSVQG